MTYKDNSSGIVIPEDLTKHLVSLEDLTPNDWNPNKMDSFMRDKLVKAIKTDGFNVPIIVRENPDPEGAKFEIVDGEHRYRTAQDIGMSRVPIVNLGRISDEAAKQITVKANALRGEFDSIKLAEMMKELSESIGMDALTEAMPYTSDRITAMIDMMKVGTESLAPTLSDEDTAPSPTQPDFQSFDGKEMKFDCKCPRCGFEFNNQKSEDKS